MQGLVHFELLRAATASRGRSFPPRTGAGGRGSPQFSFLVAGFSAEVCTVNQGLSAEGGGFLQLVAEVSSTISAWWCGQQPCLRLGAQQWCAGEQTLEHYLRKIKDG